MELQEEFLGSKDQTQTHVLLKGKRTKRQRPMSPFVLSMATSSCSSAEGTGGGVGFFDLSLYSSGADRVTTSPSNSGESTIDEEDMANCLILLAQGGSPNSSESVLAKAEVDVYQCKTCNRCFPSFQALGGHRASHKKPKVNLEDQKKALVLGQQDAQINEDNTTLSLQIPSRDSRSPNNKSRVHECSICGAEFSSGQALGGHMRRHRSMPMATSSHDDSREVKKPRTLLSLDLNLPAPEDDQRESKFPFSTKEQIIVFTASPLVDCHY